MTDQALADAAPIIVWFRDDLRLADQPALAAAVATGAPVLCVYVLDDESTGLRAPGGASRWWLHHSLAALDHSLRGIGSELALLRGPAGGLIPAVARACGARAVFWTRRYDAGGIALDAEIKARLKSNGFEVASFNGRLLYEPWEVKTGAGGPFKVFTPFWRAARALPPPAAPLPAPRILRQAPWPNSAPPLVSLDALGLLPGKPDWASGLRAAWKPGESGAQKALADFVDQAMCGYSTGRDRPDRVSTSRLSPHLRFGEISPRQVVAAAQASAIAHALPAADVEKFIAEIGWREFSCHLLFHFPDLATKNFNPRFDAFPWRAADATEWRAWTKGLTGFPIVDAGMRELWTTGYMHNRVRMICASFLVKDLLIDWRAGEGWFWDTLCDADPASNPASWQWVAGSGADAAPYFRVFNPVLQGEKFDPAGDYVRRFVPELARLDARWIHKPWAAPPSVRSAAGVRLGHDYPHPIVDHARARDRALAAHSLIMTGSA